MTRIREAERDDAAAIANVHVQTWRSTYAGVLPDDYLVGLSVARHAGLWDRWLSDAQPGHRVYAAVADGAGIVGFASFGRLREHTRLPNKVQTGEIYTLYVLPDFQGQGLGKALLTQAFAGLADAAYESAVIWVLEANPSRFFYEAMGGRKVSGRQEKFAGTMVSELAYCWENLASARIDLNQKKDRL